MTLTDAERQELEKLREALKKELEEFRRRSRRLLYTAGAVIALMLLVWLGFAYFGSVGVAYGDPVTTHSWNLGDPPQDWDDPTDPSTLFMPNQPPFVSIAKYTKGCVFQLRSDQGRIYNVCLRDGSRPWFEFYLVDEPTQEKSDDG